ncbi:enolase [Aliivibrio fischeri MJ11]|uniref:Enolase n=1 Tax=Aliivibrio fischeri (strain MJ11) TaxID=388396 RepID=B5EU97_ALIFM|nr:hypothetical protein [Aliivibrio fischeri]ACH64516.1 enolase [Aliivibrio fischeri MJ11]
MGKKLHSSILPFWEKALNGHSNVKSWKKLDDREDYIYKIERHKGPDVIVLASDEYQYGLSSYYSRNELISKGAIIYMARPESNYSLDVSDAAKEEGVSIGVLKEVLGALNLDKHWLWDSKDRKERRKREEKN